MKQYIVDAFTNKPFSGNPAAVCVMESWPSEESMIVFGKYFLDKFADKNGQLCMSKKDIFAGSCVGMVFSPSGAIRHPHLSVLLSPV